MTPLPLVERVEADGGELRVIPSSAFLDRFGRSDFRASYSGDGVESRLEELSEGIALLPFVANVLPVLWLSGQAWSIARLDATFVAAMDELRASYARSYPTEKWDGSLLVDEAVTAPVGQGPARDAVLFSGGVDSFYTSLSATSRPQTLVTVWGSDIELSDEEGWASLQAATRLAARRFGHRSVFIRSNFRHFLDVPELERRWPEIGDWWSQVQHGPGLLGLVTPIPPQGAGARTYIASSHTRTFSHAWGSAPDLDECMRWGDVVVHHHGYDASRQQKVGQIVLAAAKSQIDLRVCYSNAFAGGGNCARCEKCLRTAAAIMAEGARPCDLGIDVEPEVVVRRVMRNFRWWVMPVSHNEVFMWTDIQHRLQKVVSSDEATSAQLTLAPLLQVDLPAYRQRVRLIQSTRKRAIRLVRGIPCLEAFVKRVRASLRRLLR